MFCEGVNDVFGIGVDGTGGIFDGSDTTGVARVESAELCDDVLFSLYEIRICGLCAILVELGGVVGDSFPCELDVVTKIGPLCMPTGRRGSCK